MGASKVGGDVDALCGRCKLELGHTILALVAGKIARVRCNTCGSDHAFHGGGARGSSGAVGPRAPARTQKVTISFDEHLSTKDLSKARVYSPKDHYSVDDIIKHPSFGLGLVSAVRHDKVDVVFKMAERTLVHARGEAPAPKPAYEPPRPAAEGPADKPGAEPAEEAT
jgi:hypothetical protein